MTERPTISTSSGITLVTGATGLVGNNVVRTLLARGEAVRVLAREGTDRRPLAGLDVEIASGDVRDGESVIRACNGVRSVIHCAGHVRIGWSDAGLYQAINVDGTQRVAAACRRGGVRLVHISSTDVFGRCSLAQPTSEDTPYGDGPQVPYVLTKRASEQKVAEEQSRGLDAVIVNPGFMLGPWDWKPSSGKLLLAVGRGRVFMAPRGWLSLCDVRDVAAAIVAARDLGRPGRRYLLAGRTMQWIEAMRLIAHECGARAPLCRIGPIALRIGGWLGDVRGWLTGHEPEVNSAAVAMAWLEKNYSSARAEAELGYRIRPSEEIIRDARRWFSEHGYQ